MQIETAISTEYVPNWGMVEAIREILQEAFDAKAKYNCEVRFHKGKNKFIIEDNGPGLPISDLALGKSSKRNNNNLIGQFGEGLKLAMLVVARENRKMLIDTVNYCIKPEIKFSKVLNCNVLTFKIKENQREIGTRFEIECTAEEVEKAKQFFKEFCKEKFKNLNDPIISLPGGKIFINGVLATEIKSLFSYNFQGVGKEAQNRDRTVVDTRQLEILIENALEKTQSRKVISYFLQAISKYIEHENNDFEQYIEGRLNICPNYVNIPIWQEEAKRIFTNICLTSEERNDMVARYLGFRVLQLSWKISYLLRQIGIPTSADIVKQKMKKANISFSSLSEEKIKMYNQAKDIVEKIIGSSIEPVKLTERCYISKNDCINVNGFYDKNEDIIYLAIEIFDNFETVLMTLLHEALHKYYKAPDISKEFERAWQEIVRKMLFDFNFISLLK